MKFFISLITALAFSSFLYAQQSITGRVKSFENNLPLEGANVFLKGTDLNASTDSEGGFTIDISNEVKTIILFVNHIGYTSTTLTVERVRSDTLDVFLYKSSLLLDEVEVVSTGYQKIPKERATGSFSMVSNALFNQQVGTDVLSRLPAVANSVIIDKGRTTSGQMMVRGLSTIDGPKDPLIIIDNFPYDGDINNINPNIVENVTILKDAAASSIWGARAANGVIVITTKTGKFDHAIFLEFNSNLRLSPKPNLDYIRQISPSDFIDIEQELYDRDFYNTKLSANNKPIVSPVVDLLDKVDRKMITEEEAKQKIDEFRKIDVREQFTKHMYLPSVKEQYFLSAMGGFQKFSWVTSVGFDQNKESLQEKYQRSNLRFQNTYKPIDKITINTSLYYTNTQSKSGRLGYNDVPQFVPYMKMADEKGTPLPVARNWSQSFVEAVGGNYLKDWNYYPLTDWKHQSTESIGTNILASIALDFEILPGLSTSINYQYERQNDSGKSHADEKSYMARNYINSFAQIQSNEVEFIVPEGGILDRSNGHLKTQNIRGQLVFEKKYNNHNISSIAGIEMRSNKTQMDRERFYGYDSNNLTVGLVDYTTAYPNFVHGGSAFIQNNQYLGETNTRFVSQFANAAYTFDDRFLVSASARRDASNLFGLKTNDQWNPFWSSGLAWKLSNEAFYNIDFLSFLNLRATYGFSGNVDPAMVAVNTIRFLNPSLFTGEPMAAFDNFYNPNLRWETSKMLNFAVDFSTKRKNLSGTIEYYQKKGRNLFGMAPIDYTTGVDAYMLRNVADMKGSGVDLELKVINLNRKIKWNTILNFSLYKDEIENYNIERTLAREYVNTPTPPISGIKGKPVYAVFAYKWAGLDPNTGEAQGYLNGEISKNYNGMTGTDTKVEDLEYFGSAVPTKFGSLLNSVSYKNVSLQLGFSFKLGYWFRRKSINYTTLFNAWAGHSDYEKRWQRTGDELVTDVPANPFTTNNNRDRFYEGASALVEKGDHIRFQYINIAYNLDRLKAVKNLQVYLNINNIGVIWKANKSGIDPDFNVNTGVITPINYSLGIRTKLN